MTQQAAVLRRDDISEFISKMYEGDLNVAARNMLRRAGFPLRSMRIHYASAT